MDSPVALSYARKAFPPLPGGSAAAGRTIETRTPTGLLKLADCIAKGDPTGTLDLR